MDLIWFNRTNPNIVWNYESIFNVHIRKSATAGISNGNSVYFLGILTEFYGQTVRVIGLGQFCPKNCILISAALSGTIWVSEELRRTDSGHKCKSLWTFEEMKLHVCVRECVCQCKASTDHFILIRGLTLKHTRHQITHSLWTSNTRAT